MLNNYTFLSSIPYDVYYDLIIKYNTEISKLVLEGERVTLSKLGNLSLVCKNKIVKKTILDYKKTKENKKYFEDNNIKCDYRVYNNNDQFIFFHFYKFQTIKSLEYYKFEPTNYNNMQDRKIENYYKQSKTDNDIIINTKIGNVQKMNALIKNNVKYKLRYIQNAS
jgi:hypothetical protein